MTHAKKLMAVALVLALLGGCESMEPRSERDIGMATGAILGGALGHQIGHGTGQTIATIRGAALGGFSTVASARAWIATASSIRARARDLKNGQATTRRNLDTRHRYRVTPTRTCWSTSGPCREFTTIARFDDGRHEIVHGNACRQPDGTWRAS